MKFKLLSAGVIIVFFITIYTIFFQSSSTPKKEDNVSSDIHLKEGSIKYITDSKKKYITNNLKNDPLPTNKFWSEIVGNGKISGIFTDPYELKSDDTSLTIGIPQKSSQADLVLNKSVDYIKIIPNQKIDSVKINNYASISVNISFRNIQDNELFNIDVIEGSPYIFVHSSTDKLSIKKINQFSSLGNQLIFGNTAVFTNKTYNITPNGIEQINKNDSLTIGYISDISKYNLLEKYAFNLINSVNTQLTYDKSSESIVTNYIFNYTSDSKDNHTLWGLLPHQYNWNKVTPLMQVNTLRGIENFIEVGENINIQIPATDPVNNLTTNNFTNDEKTLLTSSLKTDINNISTSRSTSYFGGKDIAKMARLLEIANNLHDSNDQIIIENKLKTELVDWFNYYPTKNNKYFGYDKTNKGLIAYTPEFGSDQYNDHHFHYGYYIYAATILAQLDTNFYSDYKDFINLLVFDIANSNNSSSFPPLRLFDIYEGHSWASGFEDFADGNNQESTSEAINAWYSVYLWGKLSQNSSIADTGLILYSSEINSANFYWLNRYPQYNILPKEYKHSTVSLLWGGKFEYNTFFSKDDLAIKGIQYLPFTPGSMYLYDKKSVTRDCSNFVLSNSLLKMDWEDINTMYCSMVNKNYSIEQLKFLKVDDGNTISNLLNWVFYWKNQK